MKILIKSILHQYKIPSINDTQIYKPTTFFQPPIFLKPKSIHPQNPQPPILHPSHPPTPSPSTYFPFKNGPFRELNPGPLAP